MCNQGLEKESFVEVMSEMNLTELLGICQAGKIKHSKKNKVIC